MSATWLDSVRAIRTGGIMDGMIVASIEGLGHWAAIVLEAIFGGTQIFVLVKLFLPPECGGFKD